MFHSFLNLVQKICVDFSSWIFQGFRPTWHQMVAHSLVVANGRRVAVDEILYGNPDLLLGGGQLYAVVLEQFFSLLKIKLSTIFAWQTKALVLGLKMLVTGSLLGTHDAGLPNSFGATSHWGGKDSIGFAGCRCDLVISNNHVIHF